MGIFTAVKDGAYWFKLNSFAHGCRLGLTKNGKMEIVTPLGSASQDMTVADLQLLYAELGAYLRSHNYVPVMTFESDDETSAK